MDFMSQKGPFTWFLSSKTDEERRCKWIKGILEGLVYLESKNIMHRDLKPDNIMLDINDNIKILDFGLASLVSEQGSVYEKCGTPGYIAPEVFSFSKTRPSSYYDPKCDVFSLGCIFLNRIYGHSLFKGETPSEILEANKKFSRCMHEICDIRLEFQSTTSTS